MANVVVVGSQWGDEGKGKVVDVYGEEAEVIIRYQGGNNAGHTIVVNGKKVITHLVPAAALHDGKTCIISGGTVIDAEILLEEIEMLKSEGFLQTSQLILSDRAHVIMPYHRVIDRSKESNANLTHIGTTGRGIGPAYADKASRTGIRCGDLLDPEALRTKLEEVLPEKNCLLETYFKEKTVDVASLVEKYTALGEKLRPYITDTTKVISDAIRDKKKIMFEGAQGVLLDIDHGTYPFVTSSNTISGAATTGSGAPASAINEVIAITKAYTTRVGTGPFPTELECDTGELMQIVGGEFGATTGRKRRCGWLDLVALKYARDLCGFTGIALTKLDVLGVMDEVKACVGYELDGEKLDYYPSCTRALDRVKPIYKSFPAWPKDLPKFNSRADIPQEMVEYVKFIEAEMGIPVVLMSTGPDRNDTLSLKNPFAE